MKREYPLSEKEVFAQPSPDYVLRLYICGVAPRSLQALQNLRRICEEHLRGRYELEIVDLYQQPGLAEAEQIVAAPTLIRLLPLPLRRFTRNIANPEDILAALGLQDAGTKCAAPTAVPPP